MKVIISRRGFDSSAGKMASPILPDGRVISLPIPTSHDKTTWADIEVGQDLDLAALVSNLRSQNTKAENLDTIHMDPDLNRSKSNRLEGWRPALGQVNGSQTHLENHEIQIGDVFLFFGWFREVELIEGRWCYKKHAPNIHMLFGWLEIGSIHHLAKHRASDFSLGIQQHVHIADLERYNQDYKGKNTLYVAKEYSKYLENSLGGGCFGYWSQELQLTKKGRSRSFWQLPAWFKPEGRQPLSHHANAHRWMDDKDSIEHVILKVVGRGQEFVIDGSEYPELEEWVSSLICKHG